jgi:hypothetical protein
MDVTHERKDKLTARKFRRKEASWYMYRWENNIKLFLNKWNIRMWIRFMGLLERDNWRRDVKTVMKIRVSYFFNFLIS